MEAGWRCLYGNDDERPVYVHRDGLHPHSRLRRAFFSDDQPHVRVQMRRNVLLSLVATQRHMRLALIGDATINEVAAEMAYDCVDPPQAGLVDPTRRLCADLAHAIANWPIMRSGMRMALDGRSCEWHNAPLHVYVVFGAKPHLPSKLSTGHLHQRPWKLAASILRNIVMERASCEWKTWNDPPPRQVCLDDVRTLVQDNPFVAITHDLSPGGRDVTHFAQDVADWWERQPDPNGETEEADQWRRRFVRLVVRIHDVCPDLSHLFHHHNGIPSPELKMLAAALRHHDWHIAEASHAKFPPKCTPLLLPTMWCTQKMQGYGHNPESLLWIRLERKSVWCTAIGVSSD